MEKPDMKPNTLPGVFNMIVGIAMLGYIWMIYMHEINSMGMGLLLLFYFTPLMILMFVAGLMKWINAKSAPIFQFFLCLMLSTILYVGLLGGWLSEARSSARFGSWHDLIFLCSLILLLIIEIYIFIFLAFKKSKHSVP